jgi:hypothetical protein
VSDAPKRGVWQRLGTPARTAATTLGVVVALAGIWLSAVSQRETRRATQLALLTQLDTQATAAENRANAEDVINRICDKEELTAANEAALAGLLQQYEYFAWLMNTGRLDRIPEVRDHWTPRIVTTEQLGEKVLEAGGIARDYPELARFSRTVPKADRPRDVCDAG